MGQGGLIRIAQPYLAEALWLSMFPGAAVATTVLGLTLLSYGLTEIFGPPPADVGPSVVIFRVPQPRVTLLALYARSLMNP